jgi:2-dehydropantoate 2-reductase
VHVAIVGAGALGRVYAVRLSQRGGATVTLVVRPERATQRQPIRIEHIDGDGEIDTWSDPALAAAVPEGADVVLVAVRTDQLDASLDALLDRSNALVVVLAPMMPADATRLGARYGARLRAAMVGVVAYVNPAGTCRYWLPRSATTLIDDGGGAATPVAEDLAKALVAAGIRTKIEPHVQESNLATTVAIVPAAMGIDAAGSIDALLADKKLRDLTVAAIKEGLALSGKLGTGASWLGYVTPFVGSTMLRVGASLGKSSSPEAFAYVEEHFGRKLHAQNVAMGREVIELARSKGVGCEAMEGLLGRL